MPFAVALGTAGLVAFLIFVVFRVRARSRKAGGAKAGIRPALIKATTPTLSEAALRRSLLLNLAQALGRVCAERGATSPGSATATASRGALIRSLAQDLGRLRDQRSAP